MELFGWVFIFEEVSVLGFCVHICGFPLMFESKFLSVDI